MLDKSLRTSSVQRLFLVCPTDCIEQTILNDFKGKAFFCTALGVYFEFDFVMQSNLWDLICEQSIKQVVFVTAIDNVFYENVFNEKLKLNFPADEALAGVKKRISKHLIQPGVFSSNYHLLVANYLKNQSRRLMSSSYLGSRLRSEKISVNAYVYDPMKKHFSSCRKTEQMGNLINSISPN